MISSGAGAFGSLAIEIGNQAVLGAFDDVVGQALVERQIGGLLLFSFARLAEMVGDSRDVELIDRDFLLARLTPPVFGRGLEIVRVGMVGRNVGGWSVE